MDQSDIIVPYHAGADSELANSSYFIIHDKKKEDVNISGKLCHAPAVWILESIANFTLLQKLK